MRKLNIVEALAIVRSSSLLVDMEIYESTEEAIEYGLEVYQGYLEGDGFEPGDEVLEVIFDMIESISTDKEKPLHRYPAVGFFPNTSTKMVKAAEQGYLPLRGEIIREGIVDTYLYRLKGGDQTWYLAPWQVPELPDLPEDYYVSYKVKDQGDVWDAVDNFLDGPEVFINMYQEIGWYVYRVPCRVTGYWDLIAYPSPLTCVEGRIQPA